MLVPYLIGMVNCDGTVAYIQCRSPQSPRDVRQTLKRHYSDPNKLERLMRLGDIHTLGAIPRPLVGDGIGGEAENARGCLVCGYPGARSAASPGTFLKKAATGGVGFAYLYACGTWMGWAGCTWLPMERLQRF